MSKKIETIVFDIANPIAEELGYELCDCAYAKEGQNFVLTLYIDKTGGVTLEDCEKLSRRVEVVLDERDPIPEQYYLCVSSLGLDRPLKTDRDFLTTIGKKVDVKLFLPIGGKKEYVGELVSFNEGCVVIKTSETELQFERKDIGKISIHLDFGGNELEH